VRSEIISKYSYDRSENLDNTFLYISKKSRLNIKASFALCDDAVANNLLLSEYV
jgi:hypothetical protein